MRFAIVPRSIVWQLVILVAIAAAIFHACMGFAFSVARQAKPPPPGGAIGRPIVDLAEAIDLLPVQRRPDLVARFAANYPYLHIEMQAPGATALHEAQARDDMFLRDLRSELPIGISVVRTDDNRLVLRTRQGASISLMPDEPGGIEPPHFSDFALATTLFVAFSATLFLLWAIRTITIPLATFAKAADRFALDEQDTPLSETGSAEIRMASQAFNRMQARIRSMVGDRTRMLAAVGHDLRTPITRLRLRAEYISDAALKQAIVRDLEGMDGLVHSALSFLRDGAKDRTQRPLDLASLLQSVCDDFADTGRSIRFDGPNHVTLAGHSDDLRRMFSNLIENAATHGQRVQVDLKETAGSIVEIDICDDGPGMTAAEKSHAFEPFWRGVLPADDNRGFGLGLSIVRAICDAHKGTVTLLDGPKGGLLCRVRLPLKQLETQPS